MDTLPSAMTRVRLSLSVSSGTQSLPKGLREELAGVGLPRAQVSWLQNRGHGSQEDRPGVPVLVGPQAFTQPLCFRGLLPPNSSSSDGKPFPAILACSLAPAFPLVSLCCPSSTLEAGTVCQVLSVLCRQTEAQRRPKLEAKPES